MPSPSLSSSAISTPSISVEDLDFNLDSAPKAEVEKQDPAPLPAPPVEPSVVKLKLSQPRDQLRIEFAVLRILVLAVLVLGPLTTAVGLLIRDGKGFCIFTYTVDLTGQGPAEDGERIDVQYGAGVGVFMSIVNKLLDFILEILVGGACLSLFTTWSTQSEPSPWMNYAPKLTVLVLSFLLCNGPTSINVQEVPGKVNQVMNARDLSRRVSDDSPLKYQGSETQLASPWSKDYNETATANDVLNTALRTQFVPFRRTKSRCTGESADANSYEYPTVTVTTPSEDWVLSALPNATNSDASYSLYRQQAAALPIDSQTVRTLFALVMIRLTGGDNALPSGKETDIISSINKAIQTQSNPPDCAVNETTTYGTIFDCVSDESLPNVASQAFKNMFQSAVDSSAVYHRRGIADSINFTSLTISYSVKLANDSKSGDQLQCSEEGCRLVGTSMPGDQMVGIARLPGDAPDEKRLVVLSIGKRLEGDSFSIDEATQTVALRGLRMHYTLTMGLLEWDIVPLDSAFTVPCNNPGGCEGLLIVNSFLRDKDHVAMVGKKALDLSDLPNVTKSMQTSIMSSQNNGVFNRPTAIPWMRLVSVSSTPQLVLALPRNFNTVGERVAEYLRSRDPSTCVASVDKLIKGMVANHLYIEDSLQIGYTAAFHYLVQNAVLHRNTTTGGVNFAEDTQEMRVMVSIPLANAVFSLTGCAMLFVVCAVIVVSHKRSKAIIEANSSPTVIAQAMLNDSLYPRAVLSLWLERTNGEDKRTSRLVKLDDVTFERAEFRDKPKPEPKKSRKSVSTTV